MGTILGQVIAAAGPDARGWHPFGVADRSGFAAMACDEILVHCFDIATGLGLPFAPLPVVPGAVARRIFPWTQDVVDGDDWQALLWANGRAPLRDRPPERDWLWHCAPLDEWDGEIRRMPA
jgi:hypothetical protein